MEDLIGRRLGWDPTWKTRPTDVQIDGAAVLANRGERERREGKLGQSGECSFERRAEFVTACQSRPTGLGVQRHADEQVRFGDPGAHVDLKARGDARPLHPGALRGQGYNAFRALLCPGRRDAERGEGEHHSDEY